MIDLSFIGPTPEQLKYCEEWEKYMESFHDYEIEEKIDTMKIDVYFPKRLFENCKDDFEISYIENDTFDDNYGNTYLRKLFKQEFKYFYLSKSSNLYKICKELKNSIIRSPFSNENSVKILKKDSKLYYVKGKACLPRKINKVFIGYLGEIGNSTKVQKNIFDYIEEK